MRRLKTSRMLSAVVTAAALASVGAGPSGPVATAATQPGTLTSDAPVTVMASGLYEPRGLAWGPEGHLVVTETGAPPPVCRQTGPPAYPTVCFGLTGSVADVSSGTPVRIVTGLASNLDFEEMKGPHGVAYVDGQLYVVEGASPQIVPSSLPKDLRAAGKEQYGALLNVTGGSISVVANPGKVDYQWSAEHVYLAPNDFPSAQPYALTAKPGGGFYVVDAASNTLDSVDQRGKVRVLAFIPNTPAGPDSVPTCVDVGPDGAVYVGELTGDRSSETAASVYRYEPSSGSLAVWQSGFSAISGCGFGANGDFYVTEFDTTGFLPVGTPYGAVVQISPDGTRTVLGEGKLFAPNGFLAGPDGSIYVANKSMMWPPCHVAPTCPGIVIDGGEVVKIG